VEEIILLVLFHDIIFFNSRWGSTVAKPTKLLVERLNYEYSTIGTASYDTYAGKVRLLQRMKNPSSISATAINGNQRRNPQLQTPYIY
jgi:hypothetical protein